MRENSYSEGRPGAVNITLYPEDVETHRAGVSLAADMGVSFSELVWRAVEDYVTLHQHITAGETRSHRIAEDYTRMRRRNGV